MDLYLLWYIHYTAQPFASLSSLHQTVFLNSSLKGRENHAQLSLFGKSNLSQCFNEFDVELQTQRAEDEWRKNPKLLLLPVKSGSSLKKHPFLLQKILLQPEMPYLGLAEHWKDSVLVKWGAVQIQQNADSAKLLSFPPGGFSWILD